MRAKIYCTLLFFLILIQVASLNDQHATPVNFSALETIQSNNTDAEGTLELSKAPSAMSEILYSQETLLLPDALLSPIPSFQFGFIEILSCLLFIIFSFYACNIYLKEKPLFFTSSYFDTLFLSVILINAP